jgi:hypothetical protein
MYDTPPSVCGSLTSSNFNSLSFITPTLSHFLSLTLSFSVIINKRSIQQNGPLVIVTTTPSLWLNPSSRLMYLRVCDIRDRSRQSVPSLSLSWGSTRSHIHKTPSPRPQAHDHIHSGTLDS